MSATLYFVSFCSGEEEMEAINMSKDILREVLSKGLRKSKVEVLSATIHFPNGKGVNYLSDLFKVSVRYTLPAGDEEAESSECFVVKTEPLKVKSALEIVREQDLFFAELRVLRDILPRIENMLGRQIGPRLWYESDSLKILMMEDLSLEGFVMKDRQTGLCYDECLLAIKQIARLHAGSVALFEQEPQMSTAFRHRGVVSAKCPKPYLRLMEYSLMNISEAICKWEGENFIPIAAKLKKLADTVCARCTDAYEYDPGEFCVLNHGDCWTSNMMFKMDKSGKVCALRLVDYQMATYTSPAIDLLYFLYTCPEVSIKCDKDEHFLETYLAILGKTLTTLGCKTKPPTMDQLLKAIHKRRIYAVFAGIILHLRMIANKEDTEDFDPLFCEREGKTKMDVFKNPLAVKTAKKMLATMNERGYLD